MRNAEVVAVGLCICVRLVLLENLWTVDVVGTFEPRFWSVKFGMVSNEGRFPSPRTPS